MADEESKWGGPFHGPLEPYNRREVGEFSGGRAPVPQDNPMESEWTKVAGGSSSFTHPFQLSQVMVAGTALFAINVRYGTCMDVVPSNVGVDITIPGDGTWTFFLDLTIYDDGTMEFVDLDWASTGKPADSDDHAYITLGSVDASGGVITAINQAATHSLRFATCGRVEADPEADPPIDFERGTYEFWGF